ncbi:MAG: hypothetical protein PHT59_06495 [Candidatus Omnitrophica bacterium]|nr:hypothetical protein [Candidatus Omnitrophota bacterium]
MINIHKKSLYFWTDMLVKKTRFSLSRYWDGELAAIIGRAGKNCDSCTYFPELGEALRKTIEQPKPYFHCLYFPLNHEGTRNLRRQFIDYLFKIKSQVDWYDAMVFQEAFEHGQFHEMIAALDTRNVIFVGGPHLRPVEKLLKVQKFIEMPARDAFLERTRIFLDIAMAVEEFDDPVVVFCAGMASNVLIDELHGIAATMIDMGSVWDACLGLNTRIWMRKVSEQIAKRNIYGR